MEENTYISQVFERKIIGSLSELLQQQVRLQPAAICAVSETAELTFAELEYQSSCISQNLHASGLLNNECVGLYIESSLELVVGVWSIVKAGAAYLPLAPEYPDDRLRYMMTDSQTRVILTQRKLLPHLKEIAPHNINLVVLDDLPKESVNNHVPAARADDLAYIIYTSGSTGQPKGVMVEHRSIVSQLQWLRSCGYLAQGSRILQKTPMSFDAAQWEILAPAVGATVVTGKPGFYRDCEALINIICTQQVTHLQCVPTLLQALVDTPCFSQCQTLSHVFSGGEILSGKLARAFFEVLRDSSLINLYGPTECTINATSYKIDKHQIMDEHRSMPIGIPVDNMVCFILNSEMMPVQTDALGELYIGGVQLARGYLNQSEQTNEKFISSPFMPGSKLYKTGDLASWNHDGTIQFYGRVDNQIKLRGHRIELEEIALAIQSHPWVRRAVVTVSDDHSAGHEMLLACIELNPREAMLMDQGIHSEHHLSKSSKLQTKAQLSNAGLRDADQLRSLPIIKLIGAQETVRQRQETFSRKTYRAFQGGTVERSNILELLQVPIKPLISQDLSVLTQAVLGPLLRWLGPFISPERLLPKYSYASPGALYATQIYLRFKGIDDFKDGMYYFHPMNHTLVQVADLVPVEGESNKSLDIHFIGKKDAICSVYKNNISEVLEIEAGHMLGVFEEVLHPLGLGVQPMRYDESMKRDCDVAEHDLYLGAFSLVPAHEQSDWAEVEFLVQAHAGKVIDLPAGTYRLDSGQFVLLSNNIIQPRHVIAINQRVYEQSSFGVTALSHASMPWLEYIALGRALHRLQRNACQLGLMSSGYSSKSGHPLPSATCVDGMLAAQGLPSRASYFFLGGKISESQQRSEGMQEDLIHMQGPSEIIKEDLAKWLPDYMIPNRIIIFDELPLLSSGKIDRVQLTRQHMAKHKQIPYVAPSTPTQQWLVQAWQEAFKCDQISVRDNFFECGGNSLIAVSLLNKINRHFGLTLPVQTIFECPYLDALASRIDGPAQEKISRFIKMNGLDKGRAIFCWPGLGGYPMNLQLLGQKLNEHRPFFGVQSHGLNAGETPYTTIEKMAKADVEQMLIIQPEGPYSVWGYSFGARVAFETAWQLEQRGHIVDQLLLICPGNPKFMRDCLEENSRSTSFDNFNYVSILYSVFAGTLDTPALDACLKYCRDKTSFIKFVLQQYPSLTAQIVERIVEMVGTTYEFEYSFHELTQRRLSALVQIIKAQGDDYSFIEKSSGYSVLPPIITHIDCDHYEVLKPNGIDRLLTNIQNLIAHTSLL